MSDIGSPFVLSTRLAGYIGNILSAYDIDLLDQGQRREFALMRQLMADARLDARDYELSETRAEQLENAITTKNRLEKLRLLMLRSSEHDIFSAIDVAQISAQLDEIIARLR